MALAAPLSFAQASPLLAGSRLAGQGQLTWFGFPVYDASLWVTGAFTPGDWANHSFVLELTYLRPLRSADIARRSIEEMRRAGPLDDAQAANWQAQLRALLPDVAAGDRIAALNRPGRGASFFVNGKPAGEVGDAVFARRFFAIWLGPETSEPELRASLLRNAQ